MLALGAAGVAAGIGLGILAGRRAAARHLDLHGKTVLITGGSRGLGLALAREFGGAGARVALCARDATELAAARDQLRTDFGIDAYTTTCDIADEAQVRRMVEEVTAHFGQIDVLVNNAGIITAGPFAAQNLDDFKQVMAINFWGPVYVTTAVLPQMRERKAGHVVNIASIGGKVSVPHLLPYSSAKFALTGYSEGINAELAPEGIFVTTVAPGLMRTGSYRNVTVKGQHQVEYALFSVLDSLPIISVDVQRAAQQIVTATQRGQSELIVGITAQLAAKAVDLFPNVTAAVLQATARVLPDAGGPAGQQPKLGYENESAITRSPLTASNQQAADEYNEHLHHTIP
ncbi:MAG: SDR family NAD(P)-dependent oxidoreductase [Ktedonobacterales bacterium]|nr:SDR family NAD(P)-dependent oxidoreductase [Ktedonobacterales bacterium]